MQNLPNPSGCDQVLKHRKRDLRAPIFIVVAAVSMLLALVPVVSSR